MKKILLSIIVVVCAMPLWGLRQASVKLCEVKDSVMIPKEIYGQFAEHLGTCIYGGLWVGKDSKIPNVDGYRKDVLEALKALKVPVLRWPGGCFADEYHWRDGIGDPALRPRMVNNNWGALSKTIPLAQTSSSTSANFSARSPTSAEMWAAAQSRNLPNGWNTSRPRAARWPTCVVRTDARNPGI